MELAVEIYLCIGLYIWVTECLIRALREKESILFKISILLTTFVIVVPFWLFTAIVKIAKSDRT